MSKIVWSIIGISIVLGIYYIFNPIVDNVFPKCPFLALTGLQCPGCGSQRALHFLLHGELRQAFMSNAFLIIVIPFFLFLIILERNRTKLPRLYKRVHNKRFIFFFLFLVAAWWIGRNLSEQL